MQTSARRLVVAIISLVFSFSLSAAEARAASFSFITLDVPGALGTSPWGVNGQGWIVGILSTERAGFLFDGSVFKSITVSGAVQTRAFGINDNAQIAGVADFICGPNPISCNAGFLATPTDTEFMFQFFNVPGSSYTLPLGINNLGQIVGSWVDATASAFHGFIRSPNGSFTSVEVAGAISVTAYGINDSGHIVGTYVSDTSQSLGFLKIGDVVTVLNVDVPGARRGTTTAFGISNAGHVVGVYLDETDNTRGFVWINGQCFSIDVPGALLTEPHGINDHGVIVGQHFVAGDTSAHGFVARPTRQLLVFPLGIDADRRFDADAANISAVFDHSVEADADGPLFYTEDATVVTYTGEEGVKHCGLPRCADVYKSGKVTVSGYKRKGSEGAFFVNGHYTGGSSCGKGGKELCANWLFYDGHPGFDYPAQLGDAIFAPADGTLFIPDADLITSRRDPVGVVERLNILAIDHGEGLATWYLHLGNKDSGEDFRIVDCPDAVARTIQRGERINVTRKCQIGRVGNKGAGAPHLHFEVRRGIQDFQCRLGSCFPGDPYGWTDPTRPDPYTGATNQRLWE